MAHAQLVQELKTPMEKINILKLYYIIYTIYIYIYIYIYMYIYIYINYIYIYIYIYIYMYIFEQMIKKYMLQPQLNNNAFFIKGTKKIIQK